MPRVLDLALATLLVISLSLKVWADTRSFDAPDEREILDGWLQDAGFAVGDPLPDTQPEWIPARRGSCELRFAEASPLGWHRSLFARYAGEGVSLAYLFDGRIAPEQPVARTALAYFLMRIGRYLGISGAGPRVWAFLLPSGCADMVPAFLKPAS